MDMEYRQIKFEEAIMGSVRPPQYTDEVTILGRPRRLVSLIPFEFLSKYLFKKLNLHIIIALYS